MSVRTNNNKTYYINPSYLTFVEDSGYGANLIQVSASSSCYISVYDPANGISYSDADKNYRRWKVTAYNNKFPDSRKYNIYVRLDRSGSSALIVYSVNTLSVNGGLITVTTSENGEEIVTEWEADKLYYYIHIGSVSEPVSDRRNIVYDTGYLESDQGYEESSQATEMFTLDKYTSPWLIRAKQWLGSFTVQGVISLVGELVFRKGGQSKSVTDVKRSFDTDKDVPVDDSTIPTTKYVSCILEDLDEKFLSKKRDDRSEGKIASDVAVEVGVFNEGTLGGGAATYMKDGSSYSEVDFLHVRKKATFNTLTIQEVKHVGGEVILSPAAMVCSKVEKLADGWICYFNATDSDGRKVYNEFEVGDQAKCQTFNLEHNKYYWRLVTAVGDDFIVLSKTDCDVNSDIPSAGDNISQLGNRTEDDRQAAIILSAYGVDVPSYKQYKGINSYSLEGKQVTKLSPYGNELTGILNIEAGSKGAGNLEDFPEEIFKAVHIGSVNLLLNSGFTGNYKSEDLDASYALSDKSELFSRGMKHWTGTATINDDAASVSGKSATIGSLSQSVQLMKDEGYVVSFKAKGASVKVILGGASVENKLTSEYMSYSFKFTSDGIGTFSILGDATICDLQLERGTIATDWHASPYDNDRTLAEFQALKYIQDSIREGDTTILGGLILSSMIQLGNYKDGKMQKVNAGMSGIYNDDNDVAFWGGGTFEQAVATVMKFKQNPNYRPTDAEWKDLANFVVSHGGDLFLRGYIHARGGIIEHGVFKDVKSFNNSFEIDEEGNVTIVGKFETSDSGNRIVIDPNNKTISMKVTTNTKDIDVVTLSFEQVDGSYSYGSFNLTRSQIGFDEFGNEYPLLIDIVDINPTRIKLSRVNAPSLTLTNEGITIKKGDAEMRIGLTPVYGDDVNIPSVSVTGWISDLYSNSWPTSKEQVAVGGVYNDNGTLKVKS